LLTYVGDRVEPVPRKPAYHTVNCFQSDIYQRSYWYNWLSWWWALGCSKHVENWNTQI